MKEPSAKYLARPRYRRTKIGLIPGDWDVVLLDSVAKRGSGHTPDKTHPEYWGGTIKWVSLQDSERLDHLYICDTTAKITPAGIANSSAKMHPKGTVVLSRDAGVGKSAIMSDDMAVSQHFMAWTCGPSLNNQFLYWWLQSNKSEFERIAMGNTIKTIGLPYFRQLAIPLPSRTEQEAIAEALSDADALIDSLDQLLAKERQLKQGVMQELLTGGKRLPGSCGEWEVKKLGDVGRFLKGSGVAKNESLSGSIRCVRYGEIYTRHNDYIKEFHSWISHAVAASATQLVRGDVLFAGSGETKEEIGKCVAFVDDIDAYAGSDIVILRPAKADSLFLGYYLNTVPVNRQKACLVQGVSVVHIAASALAAIQVSLPSIEEQSAIAAILSDMDAEIAGLEAKLEKSHRIKQGMMQELLTGRTRLMNSVARAVRER